MPGSGASGDRAKRSLPSVLRLVAWEVTRRCNLACVHCRAAADDRAYAGELTTAECFRFLDELASFGRPVVILTGGEPLLREDIAEIAAYGNNRGLRMVLATNGLLVTNAWARRLASAGIPRVSVSLDGPDAAGHDAFRGVPGAFAGALRGIAALQAAGMEFQINTTVTQANVAQMPALLALARELGAAAHHLFLLVPTGRGKALSGGEIDAAAYEDTLGWLYEQEKVSPLQLKATCAPQYHRICRQRGGPPRAAGAGHPLHAMTRGCLGGISFCFVSHTGKVQPCGYLEVDCGDIRQAPFRTIWEQAPAFRDLRDPGRYGGKCGRCEYLLVCGGCRARAYEKTGDFLAEEPLCLYEPASRPRGRKEERSGNG